MPEQKNQNARTNRVFKSLHKPLTYLGVERTLFYFVCVGAVSAWVTFSEVKKRALAPRRAYQLLERLRFKCLYIRMRRKSSSTRLV